MPKLADKKLNSFSDIGKYFKDDITKYLSEIKASSGYNQYFRALTAQLLWLLLVYSIGIRLIPIKNKLVSNAIFFVILGLFIFLWQVIKDRLPKCIDEYLKGECFYNFELSLVNKSIAILFFLNTIIFIPLNLIFNLFNKFTQTIAHGRQK